MLCRRLGNTDLRVSVVGLGTYQLGGDWGQTFGPREAEAIITAAHGSGVNFIDTAKCYGHDHLAETLIGKAIPASQRDDWIIATKFGHRRPADNGAVEAWSAKEVARQLDGSLRALRMDQIDLYQFHSGDDAAFDNDDLSTVLDKAVRDGKVRYLGLSLRAGAVDAGDLSQVSQARARGISVLQIAYNRLFPKAAEAALPMAQRFGLAVIGRIPLARGYLSGGYSAATRFPDADLRSADTASSVQDLLARVDEARQEAPAGADLAQWAIAWALAHPALSCVVVGTKNPEQIRHSACASALIAEPAAHRAANG